MGELWLDHPRGPWILTASGRRFHPVDPRADEVEITDIAHALANTCRFGGHTAHHYSVAQHSVLTSHIVEPWLALVALMHDAAEAYVGDMVSPLKLSGQLGEYSAIEHRVWRAIVKRYDLTGFGVDAPAMAMPDEVVAADMIALVTEARDLMGVADPTTAPGWPSHFEPLPDVIKPMTPDEARTEFIDRFVVLTGEPTVG